MTHRFVSAGRRFAGVLAIALSFAATFAHAQDLVPIDRPVAIVDEDVVLRSELDNAIANIKQQYTGERANQLPPDDVLEKQVLERLILNRLQIARAESNGIRVTDQDLDNAISRIAQGNNLSVDQLRAQVTQTQTWEEFRRSIREEILIQQLRQSFAQGRISVSEAEVDAALASQANNTQFHLANLLVAVPDGATPEQIATAQTKIDGIKAMIDKGEMDFTAAAVRYSEAQNALEGGDLGFRGLDEIPPTFANMIRQMEPGQVMGPVRGPSGFQLVKLIETKDATGDAPRVIEFHARHILARVDDKHPDNAARQRIDTIAARLAGGADFETVAKAESEDETTRAQGGDLGWFASDRYGTTFGSQVAALADNGVSKPFRTDAGYHIVQRVGMRQGEADQSRRTQMREAIGRRKLEDEYARFLREMRGEAFVEMRITPVAGEQTVPTDTVVDPTAAPAEQPATPPANGG
jgi:peptidyl-prolyl cis-trans isomerase SurA